MALRTKAGDGPFTSKSALRVAVFNEEVPQMGSGWSVGGGLAASKNPRECRVHSCQATGPIIQCLGGAGGGPRKGRLLSALPLGGWLLPSPQHAALGHYECPRPPWKEQM